ncbi:MAG: HD domain-containing protein [Desulfobacterales bacterium]|nr:HD domain-containing protein [Desulfobacterales bacterium]MBS3754152.1 HD domain-containing protein [Desulfobacterales bacterium]
MAKSELPPLDRLKTLLDSREEEVLSPAAARSAEGLRRRPEKLLEADYRQQYAVDVDRILHSLAYSRYIDKTQVFYLIRNDHITHRMLHVQLVSKVARTIGRFLGLNEDLIEAVAIGHDIGHAPFGHDGERMLSALCSRHGIGTYHHNVQSVQFLEKVERKGRGWNLCLRTLDGILCHDGEVHDQHLAPVRGKTFEQHDRELRDKQTGRPVTLVPMTLEGCVVRFADTISYIGRDIEDAIRLGLIERSDLPQSCVEQLGDTNGTIVYTLVTDAIRSSYGQDWVAFSPAVSEALYRLKRFNYERIYKNPAIKKDVPAIEAMFEHLFARLLADIEQRNPESPIYRNFINGMADEYRASHSSAAIVRDFIAGMTDQYFLSQAPPEMRPQVRVF